MKEYASDKIRNVAVLSHDGAGKTAVVESLLLAGGAVSAIVPRTFSIHLNAFFSRYDK
jgi:translation elongation factor EF-G